LGLLPSAIKQFFRKCVCFVYFLRANLRYLTCKQIQLKTQQRTHTFYSTLNRREGKCLM
ncbi:hypothetical protein L9F63_001006, partial [Diploptera punctata]